MELILSLFPGIDLLGRAFEHAGFSVVRGPDTLWDSRIEDFHVPKRRFDGVIGGPPCQNYSDSNRKRDPAEGDRLVRHFLRVVREAGPSWWLMENVRNVPNVAIDGYHVQRLDSRLGVYAVVDFAADPHLRGVRRAEPLPLVAREQRLRHVPHDDLTQLHRPVAMCIE